MVLASQNYEEGRGRLELRSSERKDSREGQGAGNRGRGRALIQRADCLVLKARYFFFFDG